MITFMILLNCILNDIAQEQALQWGKKAKNKVNKVKNISLLHVIISSLVYM